MGQSFLFIYDKFWPLKTQKTKFGQIFTLKNRNYKPGNTASSDFDIIIYHSRIKIYNSSSFYE